MQKQHNYNSLSLSSRLEAYIEKVESDYERTRFYKKHWYLVNLIESFEIFTVNRLTLIAKDIEIKTTRKTLSTFVFYLHLDGFLEFTPVTTLMGRIAQLYNVDTIDPDKKAKAIAYYKGINPINHVKHEPAKNKQIQTFISTYDSGNIQSAAYAKGRIDRAIVAEKAAKEHNEQKLAVSKEHKKKLDHVARKALAKKKKSQSIDTQKN